MSGSGAERSRVGSGGVVAGDDEEEGVCEIAVRVQRRRVATPARTRRCMASLYRLERYGQGGSSRELGLRRSREKRRSQ